MFSFFRPVLLATRYGFKSAFRPAVIEILSVAAVMITRQLIETQIRKNQCPPKISPCSYSEPEHPRFLKLVMERKPHNSGHSILGSGFIGFRVLETIP